MQWFFIALAAPMTWAIINHIDKYVISRYAENGRPETLVIFSSMASGLAFVLIYFFAPIEHISNSQILWSVFAGALFIVGYIPYTYALQTDEVSIVAPLWQMVAPFSYVLAAIFLHEYLSIHQIFAGLLIISGAVLMTINLEKLAWKGRIFKLMALASLFIALNTVIFKIIGLESSFWTVSLWEYLGAFIFGLVLLSFPALRHDFSGFLQEGGKNLVSLSILGESMNIIARMFFNFAALLGPIALVYVISGTQPFFIFVYGILIFIFIPKIKPEDFSQRTIMLKLGAILLMIAGSALLFL